MPNWNAAYGNTKVCCITSIERYLVCLAEKRKISQTVIKPLIRPRGEAGSRKRGFILYEAMEMSKVENGAVLYDRMRVSDIVGLFLHENFKVFSLGLCSKSLRQSRLGPRSPL